MWFFIGMQAMCQSHGRTRTSAYETRKHMLGASSAPHGLYIGREVRMHACRRALQLVGRARFGVFFRSEADRLHPCLYWPMVLGVTQCEFEPMLETFVRGHIWPDYLSEGLLPPCIPRLCARGPTVRIDTTFISRYKHGRCFLLFLRLIALASTRHAYARKK